MFTPVYSVKLVRCGTVRYQRTVGNDQSVAVVAREFLSDSVGEKVLVFYLDGCNKLTGVEVVSQGGLHGAAILPADVFRGALLHRAAAIALAHNHPSGDPEPSYADVKMTREVQQAGKMLGIQLLDHVIVTDDKHVSLFDRGLMKEE